MNDQKKIGVNSRRFGAAALDVPGNRLQRIAADWEQIAAAGIQNILTKSLGSTTAHNVVKATMVGIKSLQTVEQVAARRGLKVREVYGLRGQAKE